MQQKLIEELEALGLENLGEVRSDLSTAQMVEEVLGRREGRLAHLGPLVIHTGHFAERSPRDSFVVARPELEGRRFAPGLIRPMAPDVFERLLARVRTYLHNRDVHVQQVVAGEGSERREVRVISEMGWQGLLARTLYRPRSELEAPPEIAFTVLLVPRFQATPELDGTSASAFAVTDPTARLAVVGGTASGGELRAAVGTLFRLSLEDEAALPLRCAVNVGPDGQVATFLGRTGNGKTALAAAPGRALVGDHEHLWTDDGLESLERGCYPRVQGLDADREPALWTATRRFGALLENVVLDHRSRRVALEDDRLGGVARAAFPKTHLTEAAPAGTCAHPRDLFLLTRDTLGVLPPIARLTADQAVFAFLTSYVSSLAESEVQPGDVRPSVQVSSGPALGPHTLRPEEYARRFMEKITAHGVRCWFVNTGWVGEPQGRGERIELDLTRRLVDAALSGALDEGPFEPDPLFLFEVPRQCPGVDAERLDPRKQATDAGEYEVRANRLALDFIEGFKRFEVAMPESVRAMVDSVPILDTDLDLMEQIGFSI